MDNLIESISEVLGPKWVQLYIKLGLEPTGRYKIETNHQSLEMKARQRNCARDTLTAWRESSKKSAKGLTEKDKMKQLLITLSKMEGFGEISQKLGAECGIHIELSQGHVVKAIPPEHKAVTAKKLKTHSSSSSGLRSTSSTRHSGNGNGSQSLPKQTRGANRVQGSPSLRSDSEHLSLDGDTSSSQVKGESSPHSTRSVETSQFDKAAETSQSGHNHHQNTPIDLNNTLHKYAILDAAQRIDKSCWRQIAANLDVHEKVIQTLAKERAIEERYYKTFKEWIAFKGDEATFEVLENVLETNSQTEAVEAMTYRLKDTR